MPRPAAESRCRNRSHSSGVIMPSPLAGSRGGALRHFSGPATRTRRSRVWRFGGRHWFDLEQLFSREAGLFVQPLGGGLAHPHLSMPEVPALLA